MPRYEVTIPFYVFLRVEVDAEDDYAAVVSDEVQAALSGVYDGADGSVCATRPARLGGGSSAADNADMDKATADPVPA